MSVSDNGGAVAIKGFNFQKATAILVILYNLDDENFILIPESEEDFVVKNQDLVYYIQVKSLKSLSLNKMMIQKKDNKKISIPGSSIIEKNLVPGKIDDRRQIIVADLIENTQSDLIETNSGLSISPTYIWSTQQKQKISSELSLTPEQITRLKNQEVFKSPFPDDMASAIIHLMGVMTDIGLEVTRESALAALGTLGLTIDTKSEIISDIQSKEIASEFLRQLFDRAKKSKLFADILDDLKLSAIQKFRINKEKVKIKQIYISLATELKKKFDNFQFPDNDNTAEMIDLINQEVLSLDSSLNSNLSLALSVDCLCNLME
ncbi:DUF4297 domain-containing protein [Leuconostoc falkenbergense]|uniref:DUF4297 domain-containing protein n=1 Tax=Leuconostoc falkenbergense TaxID=2766470 RepID=UPI0021AA6AD6|nr:DUF4297 domain-containing protein [Leuconostoc falkenbergense]MCT4377652.1 DUF4297 domain-containing protein [Leuconostoc falkenbergense]